MPAKHRLHELVCISQDNINQDHAGFQKPVGTPGTAYLWASRSFGLMPLPLEWSGALVTTEEGNFYGARQGPCGV
jgi:hypothetical protein